MDNKVSIAISYNEPIHDWFELSYASYLVVPRTVLQSMPVEWQERLVKCLEEMNETIDWMPDNLNYRVQMRDTNGRFVKDDLMDYQRGRRRMNTNTNLDEPTNI